jgi:MoaA/NifB/PqqE/SkfB family radical SAM enzyme
MLKLILPFTRAKISRFFNLRTVPYKLNLHVTYSCGSRCKTCRIWKKYTDNPPKRNEELTAAQWYEFFKKLGGRLYWLSVSGGEPFTRKDLAEIILSASTKNLLVLSINTNGQLAEETAKTMSEILAVLPENVKVFLAVSLFGSEKTHDSLSGKKGAFRKAEDTFLKLKQLQQKHANFFLERELVVNRRNLGEIPQIVDRLRESGVSYTLTFAQESEYYDNVHRGIAIEGSERKIVAELLRNIRIDVRQREQMVKRRFAETAVRFFESGMAPACYASWSSVRIDPYGVVYPCIMKNDPMGSLVNNGMDLRKTMESSENIRTIRDGIKRGDCSCWTPCEAYQGIAQGLAFDIRAMLAMLLAGGKG